MALPVNRIGSTYFMHLRGQLVQPKGQYEIDQRGGVDGTEILHLRKRGTPFTLISTSDHSSYSAALLEFNQLANARLSGTDTALDLVQSDFATSSAGWMVKVLDVRVLRCQRSTTIVGGLGYTSGAILELEWTLIGVSV